jgi:hypothetical protein
VYKIANATIKPMNTKVIRLSSKLAFGDFFISIIIFSCFDTKIQVHKIFANVHIFFHITLAFFTFFYFYDFTTTKKIQTFDFLQLRRILKIKNNIQ